MIVKSTFFNKVLLFAIFLYSTLSLSQTVILSDNFNTDWGNWTSGGADAFLAASNPLNATQVVNIQDNDGDISSIESSVVDLTPYGSVSLTLDFRLRSYRWNAKFEIQYSNDGGATWQTIAEIIRNNSHNNNVNYSETHTIDINSYIFTSNAKFRIEGFDNDNNRDVFLDNIVLRGHDPVPEIGLESNAIEIFDEDTTPFSIDNTDYGSAALGTTMTRTFTVNNTGTTSLNISGISLSNTTDFSIVGTPYSTPVAKGDNTTFSVQFNSLSIGIATATINISNNDPDEATFNFLIQAEATTSFFDSDGDGVFDNIDIDDDNDGIQDSIEELACKNSGISVTSNYKFLNETFGTGTDRTGINTTYDAITTYCYEDGTGSCGGNPDLGDGKYTVYYKVANGDGVNDTPIDEVSSWADDFWYLGEDHTPGDTNGRMAMFNAALDPGIFYTASITGALPNVPVTYSFWVLNLDRSDAPDVANRLRPDILVEFRDVNDNVLASITTGDVAPTTAGNLAGDWYNYTADLTFPVSEFNVYFYNNQLGGLGNDLAMDDIEITQTLCDTDGDGVADIFDLDSDNDGIPDVVEAGLGTISNGKAIIDTWVDNNGNGMHDAAEGLSPLDSDSDGTPNFLDLDSDNDSIFDVDESGAGNSGNPNYQNGDGDITGDGVGDGPDTDLVREKDFNSDGTSEFFTDGILDIYDYLSGTTMATAYGNTNQGTGSLYYVLDSDSDGTPDYIDNYNDSSGTFDISHTLYANLDANNDGIIDDTNDAEGDGILDLFDTEDNVFGSPRDLDQKLQLYFDGRNDYIQDVSITSGWSEISLMGWVKIDPTGSGDRFLFGQNNFFLGLLSDNRLFVETTGTNVNSGTPIPTNQWIHLGATYNSSNNTLALYVNGGLVNDTSKSGNLITDTSNFTIARRASSSQNFFKGHIDEVRLFDKALTEDEFQKLVYQEIENNGNVRGTEIPRDVSTLPWTNLIRYFRLDSYKDDVTDDLTTPSVDTGTGAKLYNIKVIDYQSAPMPFVTQQGGVSLPNAVNIASAGINGNDVIAYDWSIVKVEHNNVTFNDTQRHLGLFVNEEDSSLNPIEYHVTNDSELNVSWYLKLDGLIDLEGESQLVQGNDSQLDQTSKGKIERDQQGTADIYTYNYWSSPVGPINETTNNNHYTVGEVLFDGTSSINFTSSGYNGSAGSPITIADYWIWKFANQPDDDYSAWQHVRRTGTINAGEGFTMKGPGTGPISADQNYVFLGKPNNGDINLILNENNDYLVGNPYPSAIDANQFIMDNGPELDFNGGTDSTPLISGTLYFWEHWGGNSHNLADYQGGYATYNFSGSVAAASLGTNDPDVATGGTPTKIPGRYIPVGQGFFVVGENSGTINFNNGQRVFQKESAGSSVFVRSTNPSAQNNFDSEDTDTRMKFRIGFNSINTIHRQLLLTIDENTTPNVDWAYDAKMNEEQMDDMFWVIDNGEYIIQASNEAEGSTVYPIGIKTENDGINTITIDALENVPSSLDIFIHDIEMNTYHNLRNSDFEIFLNAGEYLNRFEMTFSEQQETLGIDEEIANGIDILYSNDIEKIVLINPNSIEVKSIEMFNLLGQSITTINNISESGYSEYDVKNLSTGTYIIKLYTVSGSVSKKVLVK